MQERVKKGCQQYLHTIDQNYSTFDWNEKGDKRDMVSQVFVYVQWTHPIYTTAIHMSDVYICTVCLHKPPDSCSLLMHTAPSPPSYTLPLLACCRPWYLVPPHYVTTIQHNSVIYPVTNLGPTQCICVKHRVTKSSLFHNYFSLPCVPADI